jgi:hypothetical protein
MTISVGAEIFLPILTYVLVAITDYSPFPYELLRSYRQLQRVTISDKF